MGQPKRKTVVTAESAPQPEAAFTPWKKPEGMSRRGWMVLGAFLILMQVPLIHRALRGAAPATASLPYTDSFDDAQKLKTNYWSSGTYWRIVDGQLLGPSPKNNPLWLRVPLPHDVAVEFDVRSESSEGDIKVEIFGNGYDHASGYILIHGGWNNTVSVIARLDEHGTALPALQRQGTAIGPDTRVRVEAKPFPVERSRSYRWRIERRGSKLSWSIDGQPFMQFDDPSPLGGKGHDRFAFSGWESQLYFDNLSVQAL
jgi:hypothetical protein